jgi:hypothetical protein
MVGASMFALNALIIHKGDICEFFFGHAVEKLLERLSGAKDIQLLTLKQISRLAEHGKKS